MPLFPSHEISNPCLDQFMDVAVAAAFLSSHDTVIPQGVVGLFVVSPNTICSEQHLSEVPFSSIMTTSCVSREISPS